MGRSGKQVGGWGYLRWVFVGRRRKFLVVVEAGEGTGGCDENERLRLFGERKEREGVDGEN
jgi:hypothetical protein